MKIQPLQAEALYAAQQVAAELFPWEHEHQLALAAALAPRDHAEFYQNRRLATVRCWTARAETAPVDEVGGIATLYGYRAQPDELWLAWFGLSAHMRGMGAGREMLDWVIAMAKNEGRKTLRLWTTDENEYAAALKLYLGKGFRTELYPALPGEDWQTLVLSLGLDGREPMAWARMPHHGDLCGREAPLLQEAVAA